MTHLAIIIYISLSYLDVMPKSQCFTLQYHKLPDFNFVFYFPLIVGNMCEININECDTSPCQNIATCIDGLNNFTCLCASGFEGNSSLLMLSGLYIIGDFWKEGVVHALDIGPQTLHIAKNIVKGK